MDSLPQLAISGSEHAAAIARAVPRASDSARTPASCQYASAVHQKLLFERGLVGSMSRKGNCWDAVMERFFLNLKMKRVWQRDYANHAEATVDVAAFDQRFPGSW